jgi:hypothetical protein
MCQNNNVPKIVVSLYCIELNNYNIFLSYVDLNNIPVVYYDWLLSYAAMLGRQTIVDYLTKNSTNPYDIGLMYGANCSTTLIDYFLKLGCKNYDDTMVLLIRYNNLTNLTYLDTKLGRGVLNYNIGLYYSTTKPFIDFFTNRGATKGYGNNYHCRWCSALAIAAQENSPELVKFFIDRGCTSYNDAIYNAAKKGNRELMDYFVGFGTNNLTDLLSVGVNENNMSVINYCLDNGVTSIQNAVKTAIYNQNIDLIDYLLGTGKVVEYSDLIDYANSLSLSQIVKHLTEWT